MAGETVFTVSGLNEYAAGILSNDIRLRSIRVSGEISGFKRHSSGHLYFNLKDPNAVISCVMFRSSAARLSVEPCEGMRVIVHGSVGIYARDGKYQLYATSIKADGEGELYRQFLELKAKLEREGLFDPERKRELPFLPRTVGVATSETGAAIRDIVTVIKRRFPKMNILLAPCQVQGASAPAEIAAAISALQKFPSCDVIIVGRGGGSYEDLYCFNDESVARAIASSRVPVISAVGHEVDFTIADFAADKRAPTPSAAAELCCPVYDELRSMLLYSAGAIKRAAETALASSWSGLERLRGSGAMTNPHHSVELLRERLRRLTEAASGAAANALSHTRAELSAKREALLAMSPERVLGRGYSIISDENGSIIGDISGIEPGSTIDIRMKGGAAKALVKEKQEHWNEREEG